MVVQESDAVRARLKEEENEHLLSTSCVQTLCQLGHTVFRCLLPRPWIAAVIAKTGGLVLSTLLSQCGNDLIVTFNIV